jgi:hypothetical protein
MTGVVQIKHVLSVTCDMPIDVQTVLVDDSFLGIPPNGAIVEH